MERYVLIMKSSQLIKQLDLKLELGLNTHVHADHITGTAALAKVNHLSSFRSFPFPML